MTNPELADRARQMAAEPGSDRPACLCVVVAADTTQTTASARKVLRDWNGPGDISARAIALLDQLERTATP